MDSYYSRYLEEKAAHQAGTELEFVAKKGEQITPINQATLTSDQERVSEILDNIAKIYALEDIQYDLTGWGLDNDGNPILLNTQEES